MDDLNQLVNRAREGDINAFDGLVRRFQDMAVGYAYALLGDFHLAQDAAQEAFLGAYQNLTQLRTPTAFPGWFRRVVYKHCDRLRRRPGLQTVPLEASESTASSTLGPDDLVEHREVQEQVHRLIATLPDTEREIFSLFYIGDYSQREIGAFMDLSVDTIKNRLRSGRKKLQKRMLPMAKKTLQKNAPSRDDRFATQIKMANACKTGDVKQVERLLDTDPDLVGADGSINRISPLHYAAREGHAEVVKLLLARGAAPDPNENGLRQYYGTNTLELARARGHDEVVSLLEAARGLDREPVDTGDPIRAALDFSQRASPTNAELDHILTLLKENPERIDVTDDHGNTVWHWAAVARKPYLPLCRFLVEQGADMEAANRAGLKPIHMAMSLNWDAPGNWINIGFLLAHGAQYDIHTAAAIGDCDRIQALLDADADLANATLSDRSLRPLGMAARHRHLDAVRLLLERGADPNLPSEALFEAVDNDDNVMVDLLLEYGADPDIDRSAAWSPLEVALINRNQSMADKLAARGGHTGLFYYAFHGDLAAVSALLKLDASRVDTLTNNHNESLSESNKLALIELAFRHGADPAKVGQWTIMRTRNQPAVLRAFFEHGVDPTMADEEGREGRTNLHFMAQMGFEKVRPEGLEVMLEYGADLHARDHVHQATPLAWAVIHNHKDMVAWFLEKGARPNLPDDQMWATPLFWAERKGYDDIAELLRQHGATA